MLRYLLAPSHVSFLITTYLLSINDKRKCGNLFTDNLRTTSGLPGHDYVRVPTRNQVLPIANSLDSRALFCGYSTLGSIPEHKFCNNKFNLFANMSQQNSSTRHDFGEEICALLGYYATYSGNSLPTFFDRQVVLKRR